MTTGLMVTSSGNSNTCVVGPISAVLGSFGDGAKVTAMRSFGSAVRQDISGIFSAEMQHFDCRRT